MEVLLPKLTNVEEPADKLWLGLGVTQSLLVFPILINSAGKGLGQSPSGRRFEPQQGHWRHYKPAASPGPRGTNRGGPALKQRDPVGTASRVRKATPGNHVGCNLSFRKLNDWETLRMADFLKTLKVFHGTSNMDETGVDRSSNKKFTTRFCFNFVKYIYAGVDWPWKAMWKIKAPFKVICLTWFVARKACLTHENFQKRGFQLTSRIKWVMPRDNKALLWSRLNAIGSFRKKWRNVFPTCIWWTLRDREEPDVF
ncbi:hypothetical protein MTR67_024255 [Solanum verrucosum]|uniref:Reverse transcriptase zinc-binding domain-containing protein n=1 Tax=Solanum verrucosum TaxID=315347 RepID=A0AAF0R1B3_SOLVR|nr:hypothetical protein MTR67_024255 [Solanum verrucosum]